MQASKIINHNNRDIKFEYNTTELNGIDRCIAVRIFIEHDHRIVEEIKTETMIGNKNIFGVDYIISPIISIDYLDFITKFGIDFPHEIVYATKPMKYIKIKGFFEGTELVENKDTKIGWFLSRRTNNDISIYDIEESVREMSDALDSFHEKNK